MPASVSLFADGGRVVYKAPGFADSWQSISAWGAGLSAYPMRQVLVKLEAAIPGGGRMRALDGKTGRVWASISANF
jgi:hypothetical protein